MRMLAAILFFLFLAFGFFERFHQGKFFVFAAEAADKFGGDGFDEDAVGRGFDMRAGAFFDLEFLAEASGDDDLAFAGEGDGFGFWCNNHVFVLPYYKSKSI